MPDFPHETLGTTGIARVQPDVTGLDKEFDYLIPDDLGGRVAVGDIVRVRLHGRSVRGWVTELDPGRTVDRAKLRPIAKRASTGPSAELVELARWASVRWAAGRLRPFLVAASPPVNVDPVAHAGAYPVTHAGTPPRVAAPTSLVAVQAARVLDGTAGLLLLPPATSPIDAIHAAAARGPALVVMPTAARAEAMAAALGRRGLRTATVPQQWARAATGVDVVIGARVAAWAPCPAMAVAVVVDEHDETLQEERAPTWHARDVMVERARRAGVPLLATSPCPSVAGLAAIGGPIVRLPVESERAGWPIVEVVDRSHEEPWKTSLLSSPLIERLRSGKRVVCVHNTPGRGRILACRTCRELARCERCDAAVRLSDESLLVCGRCGAERPPVCRECGGSAFANLRPGVTRLREELEAAAGRPVVAVTGADEGLPHDAGVYVGTEAVLHRVAGADVVAFLDFDRELLSPRYRANEQAIALLTKAARLLGRRERGGRLLIQTFLPHHDVIRAVLLANPARLVEPEHERRERFGMPPVLALAEVSGPGSAAVADQLRAVAGVTVGGHDERYLVRAATWDALGRALIATERPKGARVRVAVDPPRV